MAESRIKNSVNNIGTGIVFRFVSLLMNFFSRTLFIRILGEGCLGLNGLFTSLLSMFSLAELGIGQAITFYMYKPIAEKDEVRLASLVNFYKMCYRIIGLAIFTIGLLLIPLLPKLVNLETDTGYNLYIIYILYLINTSITYFFFSYPQTVLAANQKQNVINNNNGVFVIVSALMEILSLIITRNYYIYLIVKITVEVVKNIFLALKAIKLYPYIIAKNIIKINLSEIKVMFKDVYALFVVKLSGQLFNSTDNLFISAMFGTVLSGYNSNYLMIINAIYGVISTVIYSMSGSIGNLYATETKEKTERVFAAIDTSNQFVSLVCTICLFQLLNPFISLVWGSRMIFSLFSVALMSAAFYIVSSLYGLFAFRQSMGLFRYCIYNQFAAAVINIALDYILGKAIGIEGLFLSTVIANVAIAVFPYARNIYEVGFEMPSRPYIFRIIKGYFLCILSGFICWFLCRSFPISYAGLIGMGFVAVITSVLVFLIFNWRTSEMKLVITYAKNILKIK